MCLRDISKSMREERISKIIKCARNKCLKIFGVSKAVIVNRHQTGLDKISVHTSKYPFSNRLT